MTLDEYRRAAERARARERAFSLLREPNIDRDGRSAGPTARPTDLHTSSESVLVRCMPWGDDT